MSPNARQTGMVSSISGGMWVAAVWPRSAR